MRVQIEFNEYETPDGIIMPLDDEEKMLLTEEGWGMPPIRYYTQSGPEQHGETVLDYRLEPRIIQLMHRTDTCDRYRYWDARSELINILRPNRQTGNTIAPGILRKKLPDGKIRQVDVFLERGPVFQPRRLDVWDEWGYTETIRFVAKNPIIYDPTLVTLSWTLTASDNLVFPITFPIMFGGSVIDNSLVVNYGGTWLAYPVITVVGPINGLQINNLTTGRTIQLNYSISTGETVYFDLSYGNKRVYNNLNERLIGAVAEGYEGDLVKFFLAPDPMAPSGVNTLSVLGGGAVVGVTSVSIEYYTTYIGI